MINKVILIGNLGSDPELRYTPSGSPVATLSVATSRKWKDKGGDLQDETEWHRVVVWGSSAEFCGKYLVKGGKVYVEGRLQTRKWQAQDGSDRYTTEVVANVVQSLSPKIEGGGSGQGSYQGDPGGYGSTGEDVPF